MTEELQPIEYPGLIRALKTLAGGAWDLDLSPLANRKLAAVEVSDDKEQITFRFEDGFATYQVEGDCCSSSWVEHLTVPPDIAGAEITAWSEQDMGQKEEGYETIKVYQTSFRTPKGDIVVEYRNSSNGYYGGWIRGPVAQDGAA